MLSVIRMDLLKLRSVAGAMFPLLIIVFFLSATLSVSAAVFLYVIVVYFFVYTPAAYDEQSKGDYLTGSLPVRREKLVAAKYLYDLAVVAGACLAALAARGDRRGAEARPGRLGGGDAAGAHPDRLRLHGVRPAAHPRVRRDEGPLLDPGRLRVRRRGGDRARHERGRNARADAFGAAGWLAPLLILFGAALLAVSYPIARRLYARRQFTD